MAVIDGPNLVGGSLLDLVVPCQYDHGPWEEGSRLFTASRTNDNRSLTVFGGCGFIYYANKYSGPPHWTRATSGYPATNINYFYQNAQPHKVGSTIYCLAYNTSNSKYSIGQFDCTTLSYAARGAEASLSISTSAPICVRKLANGDVLVFATGSGGSAGFYRYSSGSWSSFVSLSAGNQIVGVVDDGSLSVAHALVLTNANLDVSYRKVFADNSLTSVAVVAPGLASSWIGMVSTQPYGNTYDIFNGRFFVAHGDFDALKCLVSDSALDDTATNPTFTSIGSFAPPASADPSGFASFQPQLNVAITNESDLYLVGPANSYDVDGAVLTDKVYTAHWNGSGFDTLIEAADFKANPPTAEPGDTLPDSSSQYSHFHSIHGLSDGNFGTVCDFLDDIGGCTSYYIHFAPGSSTVDTQELIADLLAISDSAVISSWVSNLRAADSFVPSDAVAVLAAGHYFQLVGDAIILTESAARTSQSLGDSSGASGSTDTSGQFEEGGGVNSSGFCIFEFYEMEHPEQVEILPVPKKYDQLGPMRFDKIAKIFGFRIRLIMNGTTQTMPYEIYGDDSPTAKPGYSQLLFRGNFQVRPGTDYVYEIQLPKSVNSDIVRLVFGPTADSFHRYDVLMKIHQSGMQGNARWIPIK